MRPELHATYRLQLHAGFTFDDAAAIVPYLAALGVSHVYASPILQAVAGSPHGYDVVDHGRISEDLGGMAGLERLSTALDAAGLGLVVDIVPNHMAVGSRANGWWWDVLENGPASLYAANFDIDWDPPEAKLRATVLVPVLGDHYGRVLEAGEIVLVRDGATFTIRYHDHALPVSPRTLDTLLASAAEAAGSAELADIASAVGQLPPAVATDETSVRTRHRDKEALRERLAALCRAAPPIAAAIDAAVAQVNADPDALDTLLQRQNYRLAFWRTGVRELDYRRFFDVTNLVALRTESPAVFADTHALVLDLVRAGVVDGLRIDHPDGLRDPEAYCARLRREVGDAYVAVEKILGPEEPLRASWPVDGTTGYDFIAAVDGLFVDPAGEPALTQVYADFTNASVDWESIARESKHAVMRDVLAAEVERLTAVAVEVCERHRRYRDYTRVELRDALRALLAAFPVYRTYVRVAASPTADDVRLLDVAAGEARRHRPDLDAALLDFLRDVLLLRQTGPPETELALRFQQVTASVMAKGVEDTAFYRFARLLALCEVGGNPGYFGLSIDDFHARNRVRLAHWPRSLLTVSTHDTKRSADVRLRLCLLSEMPEQWAATVRRWTAMNIRHRRDDHPDRHAEYVFYQTLVGAFPLSSERAVAYMEKATREAKMHTSWLTPNATYDAATRAFVEGALADAAFIADVAEFTAPLVGAARVSSLAEMLLLLTAPGVPDIYQGTELWDLSLVDPDNRRPVDFAARRELLEALQDATPDAVMARVAEGAPKLWLVQRTLALRRCHAAAFAGAYEPLQATGERAEHVVAFARGGAVVTVVPRLVLGLAGSWRDTVVTLPSGCWRDVLGGGVWDGGDVPLARLLRGFPVALLARE